MQMKELLVGHLCKEIRNHDGAMQAVIEFVKNVPGDVLEIDIEPTAPCTRAFVADTTVYKLGLGPTPSTAFIEIFASGAQLPSMSLYVDESEKSMRFSGASQGKRFNMQFVVESDGNVKQSMHFDN